MDSILTSIKKQLGIEESYTHFDSDIMLHINTAFMSLNQLGVGPEEGYHISSATDLWTDFLEATNLEGVKSYIFFKVKLMFDPPASSYVLSAIERMVTELEFRLNVQAYVPEEEVVV